MAVIAKGILDHIHDAMMSDGDMGGGGSRHSQGTKPRVVYWLRTSV
jgi:hypothetical protein